MARDPKKPLPPNDAAAAFDHYGDAIKHEIARYSVRIVTIENGAPKDAGSGTCVKVGPRFLIFTAAHVVLGHLAENLWIISKGGAMDRRVRPLRIGMRGGRTGQALDVGYIELCEADVQRLQIEALPQSRLSGRPIATDEFIALSGIPGETLTINKRGPGPDDIDYIWQPFIAITMQKDASKWHDEIDKSVAFEADYPEHFAPLLEGDPLQKLPDVPGMSGGGYWLCALPKIGEMWGASQIELAATITHWHQTKRYVEASRIANTVGLLSDDFPEWRSVG